MSPALVVLAVSVQRPRHPARVLASGSVFFAACRRCVLAGALTVPAFSPATRPLSLSRSAAVTAARAAKAGAGAAASASSAHLSVTVASLAGKVWVVGHGLVPLSVGCGCQCVTHAGHFTSKWRGVQGNLRFFSKYFQTPQNGMLRRSRSVSRKTWISSHLPGRVDHSMRAVRFRSSCRPHPLRSAYV